MNNHTSLQLQPVCIPFLDFIGINNLLTTTTSNDKVHYFGVPIVVVQAALVIRGFSIRGFDYSRSQKLQITRENCHF
jgi:hypothetical protein